MVLFVLETGAQGLRFWELEGLGDKVGGLKYLEEGFGGFLILSIVEYCPQALVSILRPHMGFPKTGNPNIVPEIVG